MIFHLIHIQFFGNIYSNKCFVVKHFSQDACNIRNARRGESEDSVGKSAPVPESKSEKERSQIKEISRRSEGNTLGLFLV